MEEGLELERLRVAVDNVNVAADLVSSESHNVAQVIVVGERRGWRRGNEADGDALVAVEQDLVKLPCLGPGKAVVLESGILGRRRGRWSEDGLSISEWRFRSAWKRLATSRRLRGHHHGSVRQQREELVMSNLQLPNRPGPPSSRGTCAPCRSPSTR